MTKHHILCVHGIGSHSDTWIDTKDDGDKSFKELFMDTVASYPKLQERIGDSIKMHSIHYNERLEKELNRMEEHLDTLTGFAGQGDKLVMGQEKLRRLLETSREANEKEEFWRTHAMDLVLFAGLGAVMEPVCLSVADQIQEKVNDIDDGDRIHIIGHSMGTAVVEKVLVRLYGEGVRGQTLKGHRVLSTICLIANCAYTLSRRPERFDQSHFRPSGAEDAMCDYMFSINHRFDPVGQFRPFIPNETNPDWLNPEDKKRYINIKLARLSSADVHSINHYFRDPQFHIPYLRTLCGRESAITEEQENEALEAFEKSTPLGAFKSIERDLKAIKITDISTFERFHESVKHLLTVKKNFTE